MILLNPGPANTRLSVKEAQFADYCPRTKEFGEIMQNVCRKLRNVCSKSQRYDTVLFGSSGTGAIESVISSAIGKGSLLVISNGAYGIRAYNIAKRYGIDVDLLDNLFDVIDWDSKWIRNKLESKKYSHLFVVHSETTTGILNDINKCGKICAKYDIRMIVDAMSSFGAHDIDMERDNISYLISSANKNLEGMPGTSFVIFDTWELNNFEESKSFYFDFKAQYDNLKYNNQTRFTPPVQSILALDKALDILEMETREGRYKRYSQSWETLYDGMIELGFKPFTDRKNASKIITCFWDHEHPNFDFDKMYQFLENEGFIIYPGKMPGFDTFRVANIGDISYRDIKFFLIALKEYMELSVKKEGEKCQI